MHAWVLSAAVATVLTTATEAPKPKTETPKPKVDKTQPARMEQLFSLREGDREVAHILTSSLVTLDDHARARSPMNFDRYLVRFADGSRIAMYSTGDYRQEGAYLIQALVVDAHEGEWVLLTIKGKTARGQKGYGAAKAAIEDDDERALVGFETRRLRITPEYEQALDKGNTGEVFRTAEPRLVELIQRIRESVPRRGDPSITRTIPEMFADYLGLPEVRECSKCTVETLRRSIANDEPQRAAPLDPHFEAEFGKWASWRDLPRLKGN